MIILKRQTRLDDYLETAIKSEVENCRINNFSVRVFIEISSKAHIYIENLEMIGSSYCKERLYLELAISHGKSYLIPIGHKILGRNAITSLLPLAEHLAEDKKGLKKVEIRLVLKVDAINFIPLTEYKTIEVEYEEQKKPEKLENEKKFPPPEICEHEWITVAEQRNMRGDIVAVLKLCGKCGLTKRENVP